MIRVVTSSAEETKILAQTLGKELRGGEILALTGNLGSGKTTFVKGLAQGLGLRQKITSPTFVLMQPYSLPSKHKQTLYHFDFYRLRRPAEVTALGLKEYLRDGRAITVIEWPKLAKKLLPARTIHIKFREGSHSSERAITIKS